MGTEREVDLLNGSIVLKIIQFAFPILVTNVLQTLFNAADMIIVGLSGVEGAIGAIGTTIAYIALIINIFIGLSVGSSIVVSTAVGERNEEKQSKAVHTAILVVVFFGFVCSASGILSNRKILSYLGDEGHVLELAVKYSTIYFIGVPFVALSNVLIAVFRAKGDSKTPMVAMVSSGLLNVALNLISVLIFKMSVDGVAIATVVSNLVSGFYLLFVLSRDEGACRFRFKNLKIDRYSLKTILYNGIPSAIQSSLFAFPNMLIQGSIISLNNMYCPGSSIILDGHSAGNSIEMIAGTANDAFVASIITSVSQNRGARNYERLKRIIKYSYLIMLVWTTVFPALILIVRRPFISLYVSNPKSIKIAEQRLWLLLGFYPVSCLMNAGSAVNRALGKAVSSAVITLFFCCFFRIMWVLLVFPKYPTYTCVNITYPITWLLSGICLLFVSIKEVKKFNQPDSTV